MTTPTRRNRLALVLKLLAIAVAIAAGIVERIVLLGTANGAVNSDEAMAGLMAKDLARGHFHPFLWGQPYGGVAEVIPLTASVRAFGATTTGLRFFTLVFGVVAAVLVWRIATRLLTPMGAVVAGVLMWIWPAAFVAWSMHEFLYYEPVLVAGLVGVLCAYRLAERRQVLLSSSLLGLSFGLGWWMSPFVAYFGVFAVIVLVADRTWGWRNAVVVAASFVVGASPWLLFNARHHLVSLKDPTGGMHGGYVDHLSYFFHTGTRVSLGLQGWYSQAFVHSQNATKLMIIVAGILFLVAFAHAAYRWRKGTQALPVELIALAVWPFIYALSPITGSPTTWIPRYFFLIWPFVAVAVGRLLQRWYALIPGAALIAILTVVGVNDQRASYVDWPETGPLRAALRANNVERAFSSYWVAYRITYETDERVIATPSYAPAARHVEYDTAVKQSPNPAWIFRHGDKRESNFIEQTKSRGITAEPIKAGAYDLFIPTQKLLPTDLSTTVAYLPEEGD